MLVTGATGFVGRAVCAALARAGYQVTAAVRTSGAVVADAAATRVVGEIGADTRWEPALAGVDAVVHLAGRAHQLRDRSGDPLAAFRAVNAAGTAALARQAAAAGVRRLVFVSSIGVHGDRAEHPITEATPIAPHTPYAASKAEAEAAVWDVARATGLEAVVVRPTLVYGPGAPGNIALLLRALARGVPLPLAHVRNHRTLLDREALAQLLVLTATHPAAAGQTFVAGDATDVSTPDLIRALAEGIGRPARLLPLPVAPLAALARAVGREATWRQLAGSLRVSSAHAATRLGWVPARDVHSALAAVGRHFRAHQT